MIDKRQMKYGLLGFVTIAVGVGMSAFITTVLARGVLMLFGVGVAFLGMGLTPLPASLLGYEQGKRINSRNDAVVTGLATGLVGHVVLAGIVFLSLFLALVMVRVPGSSAGISGGGSTDADLASTVFMFMPVLIPSAISGGLGAFFGWKASSTRGERKA